MLAPVTTAADQTVDGIGRPGGRWRLWLQRLFIGAVIAGAAVTSAFALSAGYHGSDAITVLVLLLVALGYDLMVRRFERTRRLTSAGPYVNMNSVWLLSVAIALTAPWVIVATVVLYGYDEIRIRRDGVRRPVHRFLFNTSVGVLVAMAAFAIAQLNGVLDGNRGDFGLLQLFGVGGAIAAAAMISSVLIGIAIALARPGCSVAEVVGSLTDNVLEVATLCLGALVGIALLVDVWFCLLAIPAMLLLQRSALVAQLESAASEDSKTGLLNAAAWQHLAERHMARNAVRRIPTTVLVIDLDHFKKVNDTYGHLAGDEVLRAVADSMKGLLRDHDLLSRFGGEEFFALLPGADVEEALLVAERLRQRIADVVVTQVGDPPESVLTEGDPLGPDGVVGRGSIRVTVSVGIATFPAHGETLHDLLLKADTALYSAKNGGRNRVELSS